MASLRRLGRQQQDGAVARLVRRLEEAGVVPPGDPFDPEVFQELRARVRQAFDVPETSITPMMARTLFALATRVRPRRTLGLGTYLGNALVWLAAPAVDGDGGALVVGVDIDPAATARARDNFRRLAPDAPVRLVHADARDVDAYLEHPVDLLYVDVDAEDRKRLYVPLVRRLLPYLSPGGLVLAHDVCEPVFADDMAAYRAFVRAEPRLSHTVTLAVDPSGVEVSRVAAGEPAR